MAEKVYWICALIYVVGCLLNIKTFFKAQKENKETSKLLDDVKKLHARATETLTNINRTYFRRVHAHWIPREVDGRGWTNKFECSECHCTTHNYCYIRKDDFEAEHCQFCGAQMDEEVEE